jgi:transcription-repair coupling factor (superfamily II helicase)
MVVSDLEEARDAAGDLSLFLPSPLVLHMPDRDLAPYEPGPVSPQLGAERLRSLNLLPGLKGGVVVATGAALQEALPSPERLRGFELAVAEGESVDRDRILEALVAGGYRRVDLVELAGDFAVRGSIIDVICPSLGRPLRIELDGDRVASLRHFAADSQRSLERVARAVLGPSTEVLLTGAEREAMLARLPEPLTNRGARRVAHLRERLESGTSMEGEERYLPWMVPGTVRLHAHFPANTVLVVSEPVRVGATAERLYARAAAIYEDLSRSREPVPRPEEVVAPPPDFAKSLDLFPSVGVNQFASVSAGPRFSLSTRPVRYGAREFPSFTRDLKKWGSAGMAIAVACEAPEEMEAIASRLKEAVLLGEGVVLPSFPEGCLSAGVEVAGAGLVLLPARDVLGAAVRRAPPRRLPKGYRDVFSELNPGDPVVHEDYGIGLYRGVRSLPIEGTRQDFFILEYADSEKLYLPVDQVHRVQKYLGAGKTPVLSHLGTEAWERTKARVKLSLRKFAEELLRLYAERQVAPARAFPAQPEVEGQFSASFPYEETADQERSIGEVLGDLEKPRPTDRLVCGDVGYGKTEVALRAVFRVAMQGAQAGVLVPTTILAHQHFENFRLRLAGTPVRVGMLSRFRSPPERKALLADLASGRVDVVVGTHQLLAKGVAFRDLGLLVIDEEHRFGVRQKEKLKELKKNVHVLTLSATPIPRTLNMGLSGLRDLSLIESPPPGRLSVITHVHEDNPVVAREAILRELARGGQVFYLHNRVRTIFACAQRLKELVPEARLKVAHGQMPQKVLEKAMEEFASGKADVLVCTSIIGAGLDLPNANTLIVERSDTFGLADLYQIRGRVGRSSRQAYAYFFFPARGVPTLDARRRLAAMLEFGELGSGFRLAVRDLEIRGAGNLLGPQQHGVLLAVGFDLYSRILGTAVRELRGEVVVEAVPPRLNLALSAYLPENYAPDGRSKLEIYKRLASCANEGEVAALREELADRFGPPPPEVSTLLGLARARIAGTEAGLESAARKGDRVTFVFRSRADLDRAVSSLRGNRSGDRSFVMRVPPDGTGMLEAVRSALAGAAKR